MTQWQKSTFSSGTDGSNCVELAAEEGTLLLRESDAPTHILPVSREGMIALLRQVQANRA